jgi:proteasome assembly chaperone (PAC2) family protein
MDGCHMEYETFHVEAMPTLTSPVFIIGFRGWGNALEVSAGMATYLVDTLMGVPAGRIDADRCYRYDENRPVVKIDAGRMTSLSAPGGRFYAIKTNPGENDLMIMIADEPHLNWHRFSRELVDWAQQTGSPAMITLGSMFDNVLHTDQMMSTVATGREFEGAFNRHRVMPINYHGPSAIHTLILDACRKQALTGASLWCHCPAYLQGIVHHGMMHALARLLMDMAGFSLTTDALENRWEALEVQIQALITANPKIEEIMDQIRRKKRDGARQNLGSSGSEHGNIINLKDFLEP